MIEPSIGAFASEPDGLFVRRARTNVLDRVAPDASLERVAGVALRAQPADQWLRRNGRLVELVQAERSADARIIISHDAAATRSLVLAAPDPPTCRGFDVAAGALWFARRDLDRVDLLSATLEP